MNLKLHRVLQVLVLLLALDAAIGSLLLLVGNRALVLRLFPYPPEPEVTDLLLLKQREWGALGVAITIILIGTVRKPQSNLLVLMAFSVSLMVAAAAELAGLVWFDSGRLYPPRITAAHALIRIAVAAVLAYSARRVARGEA